MSAPSPIVASPPLEASTPSASARSDLAEHTRAFADGPFQTVASAYLAFRKEYYHEAQPSLAALPPAHAEIRKSELALLVESTLRLVPQAVKSVPLVGGFVRHLQQVADIHSISEDERTALHNLTIGFLRGVQGGIQPWYVEWLLTSARNLSQIRDLDYYLNFPFDGLLYRDPDALTALESAVRSSDETALRGEIERMANQLVHVLGDPVGSQPLLAFTGPDGEHRKLLFNLETTAGLALLAYLIAAEARLLLRPRQTPALRSALAPLPRQSRAQAGDA
jgi:hypothetical protein